MQKYKAKNAVELLGREEEVVAASDALAEIEKRDKEIDFCQQQIANFNPCGHTEFESMSCGVCGYPDSVKYIAALTEKLRLSSLRGDSLDRVIGESVQKEIALAKEITELKEKLVSNRGCIGYTIGLEKEIAELKDELNTERLFHKSFVEATQAADKDYEESILKLKILYVNCEDQLMSDRGRPMVHLDEYVALKREIKRIKTLINDDKRADRVASKENYTNWPVLGWRKQAINDYRADIKEEIESPLNISENVEKDHFAIADVVIATAYPDCNNRGGGWWGEQRIPNYGILRGAIEKAIREASDH